MKYNFYLIKNILKIYLDEILWNLRINIYLIFFGKKNKIGKALFDLKVDGIAVINNYFDINEVEEIKNKCLIEIKKLPFDELNKSKYIPGIDINKDMSVEKIDGSIKIKNLENSSTFFSNLSHNKLIKIIANLYLFRIKSFRSGANLIYNLTFGEKISDIDIKPLSDGKQIANATHIDKGLRGLKALVALDNINSENGPFKCIKQTSFSKDLLENYYGWLLRKDGFDNIQKPEIINFAKLRKVFRNKEKFVAKLNKGDLVLFESRSIHLPSTFRKGQRHLLWYYF